MEPIALWEIKLYSVGMTFNISNLAYNYNSVRGTFL